MANLGSLVYYIRGQNSQFKNSMRENKRQVKDLDREVKKNQATMQRYSRTFKRVGMALTAFGAIVTGVSFKLAKMASDANEIQTRFNHVFGELSKDANKWAENFAESFGQSRSEVKSMMATLQDTLVPMGVAEEKAFKLNKQITQLAIDMSSFANVPLKQAMNDIMSAIVGQSRPMRKYGSVLTENRVKSYALAEGIADASDELTEQEKIIARVQLMLQDMTKAQGDYKRTQDSFANQLREVRNTLKNLGETIGKNILPVFAELLDHVKDALEWFEELPESTQKVISKWMVWSGIITAIVGPLALIVGYLPQIASGLGAMKTALAGFGPAGWVIVGFGTLVGLLSDTTTEVEELENALSDLTTTEMKARKEMLKTELERFKQKAQQRKESGADATDSIASSAVSMGYEQKISDLEQKIQLLEDEIYRRENQPQTKTGGNERPGWLGDGTGTGGSGSGKKEGQDISKLMLSAWELDVLKTEDPLQKELKRLEIERKKALAEIGQYGVARENASALAKDIWEKYEIKKQEIIDEYDQKEQEKAERKAEQQQARQDEIMRNKWALEEISKDKYEAYLKDRLNQYDKYSDEWMSIYQELQDLETNSIEEFREKVRKDMRTAYAEGRIAMGEAVGDAKNQYASDRQMNMYNDPRMKNYRQGQIAGQRYEKMLDNNFVSLFNKIGFSIEEAQEKFEWFRQSLIDGFTKAITEGKNLMDVLTNIADQIAAMIIKKGIVTPIVDWGLSQMGMPTGHSGGLVTSAGIIPSFHNGGLANDEIVAKLQTGERVLSREQNQEYEQSQGKTIHIVNNIKAMDSQDVYRALKNNDMLARVFGEDYNNNGTTRKVIKRG